ncbi:hypothetical protein CR513_50705, partial [Mucuna pruriens]
MEAKKDFKDPIARTSQRASALPAHMSTKATKHGKMLGSNCKDPCGSLHPSFPKSIVASSFSLAVASSSSNSISKLPFSISITKNIRRNDTLLSYLSGQTFYSYIILSLVLQDSSEDKKYVR